MNEHRLSMPFVSTMTVCYRLSPSYEWKAQGGTVSLIVNVIQAPAILKARPQPTAFKPTDTVEIFQAMPQEKVCRTDWQRNVSRLVISLPFLEQVLQHITRGIGGNRSFSLSMSTCSFRFPRIEREAMLTIKWWSALPSWPQMRTAIKRKMLRAQRSKQIATKFDLACCQ